MLISETTNKPLPEVTDQTRPFWEAAKAGQLVLQTCQACRATHFRPSPWCVECGSRDLAWQPASGLGTVYTYTVSHVIAMNLAGWEGEMPVLMCLIDLDEGARLYGQVTGCAPEEMRIGMRVRVYFEDLSDEIAVPKFKPAD